MTLKIFDIAESLSSATLEVGEGPSPKESPPLTVKQATLESDYLSLLFRF